MSPSCSILMCQSSTFLSSAGVRAPQNSSSYHDRDRYIYMTLFLFYMCTHESIKAAARAREPAIICYVVRS